MPHLTPPLHTALRAAVAARFGQPLRYPSHCDALEQDLQKAAATGGRRLSPSTLRRFFGLVDKAGGYHLHTLDTLARYAGHADFAAFGRSMLEHTRTATLDPPTDIPELLTMQQLARPERLLLGYFLGRVTRPATPRGQAAPLALRLAAHPAGQEFFVESFVDLAYLNGYYGEVLSVYVQHKSVADAQLFGHCTLFLGEFLAEEEPAWRARLKQVLALPVPADVHAFPQGRRAFAELVATWYDAPAQPLPTALLARLQREAMVVPRSTTDSTLPTFYNLFPAGYHFLVAEALFLTGHFAPLLDWVRQTWAMFPEAAALACNVYTELLRAFEAVAAWHVEQVLRPVKGLRHLFTLDTHSWLLDYYRVHLWLVELHFASDTTEAHALLAEIDTFSLIHRMPFFQRVAQAIMRGSAFGSPAATGEEIQR